MFVILKNDCDNEVAVNPALVSAIIHHSRDNYGSLATLRFSSGSSLTVSGTVQEIVDKFHRAEGCHDLDCDLPGLYDDDVHGVDSDGE